MLLEDAVLVVAHPDDEILWFSSIIEYVEKVVVCFLGNEAKYPERAAKRQRVLDRHPIDMTCLGLDVDTPEPAVHDALVQEVDGYTFALTHNPWGEYGHPLHVQTNRTVSRIVDNVWFSNYAHQRIQKVWAPEEPFTLPTDRALAHQVRDLYIEEGCWTAPRGYQWPTFEMFARFPHSEERSNHPFPLHVLDW